VELSDRSKDPFYRRDFVKLVRHGTVGEDFS
jgi:hypothetical protein